MRSVRFIVNGKEYCENLSDPGVTLLSYLRSVLGLTAAKNGCGEGHCGACTALIDGKPSLTCRVKLADMDGKSVRTLESLGSDTRIHALQHAFLEQGAVQCGFCTPGMVMAAQGLLERNPDPSEDEIRAALRRNLCRCTGYVKIIRAVKTAALHLRQGRIEWNATDLRGPDLVEIGKPVIPIDGLDKVTGRLKFADDLAVEGMLYAKVLRSEQAHASVEKIDVSKARQVAGVVAVLTAADVPGRNAFGVVIADQPVFAEHKVLWVGEALAAVYAESEVIAERALDLIEVTVRPQQVISNPTEAIQSGASLHPERKSNLFCEFEAGRGDVEEGFKAADHVAEDEYQTPFIEHAYLEPESCLAVPEPNGRIRLHVASQGPQIDVKQIAASLAVDENVIHISSTPMGGGFGGKEDITVQIIAALGALKTRRPVKLTLTRRESIRVSTKRHAFSMRYRTGITREGRITAVDCQLISDNGAYASVGESVLVRASSFACGPYEVPNARVRGQACFTNSNPAGAMRGYGCPQVSFAAEVQLNRLAAEIGIDPFEVRLRNGLAVGSKTITGERLQYSVGVKECLVAVRDAFLRSELPRPRDGWRIGVGVAASYKNVGIGAGYDDHAEATGEITREGILVLRVGSVDMGQGANTTMAQIAAARLGWPFSKIVVHSGDTDADPFAGVTTASKQTFLTGNAVCQLADRLKERMCAHAAGMLHLDPAELDMAGGMIVKRASLERLASLESLLAVLGEQHLPMRERCSYSPPATRLRLKESADGSKEEDDRLHVAYCFGAQAFVIEAEEATGRVNVLKVIAASDVGTAINPLAIEGQMEGGIMMGIGYALSEEYRLDRGQVVTGTLAKLGVPRIDRTPEIQCLIVGNPHREGPFGAKGMAELPTSMAAPAIVSAIHDALGVWITSLPATPQKVRAALAARGATAEGGARS